MFESGESSQSNDECSSNASEPGGLSLVAEFDEVIRMIKMQRNDEVEDIFLDTLYQMEELRVQYSISREECCRLQRQIVIKDHELGDLESKLNHARKMVDHEKRHSRKLQDENETLAMQLKTIKDVLIKHDGISDDAKKHFAFLNASAARNFDPNQNAIPQLSAIQEVNTTGSLLSDFSYSRSEDDLDVSSLQGGKVWKKHRPSGGHISEPAIKKRRSSSHKVVEITNSDSVRATTTLTVPKHGPITATSIIESVPGLHQNEGNKVKQPVEQLQEDIINLWQNSPTACIHPVAASKHQRQHTLQTKTVVMPDSCGPCEKRIRFGKTALKCKDCRATCHPECQDQLPLPCIPHVNTPTQRNILGLISDYTPITCPMVPAIVVHCLNEIELRGLSEIGLYRIPGAERDVKQLKEKFLRGKGSPSLNQIDVHVICGVVKDFLRSLQEPLVTFKLWPEFVRLVETNDNNIAGIMYEIIAKLPQPNRDTLAYMIMHLKRISESKECKMPISNLSKIFGPTIVGYSSADPHQSVLIKETKQQNMVMEKIMNLPTEYWSNFLTTSEDVPVSRLQQTPSTDSLLRPTNRSIFTPNVVRSTIKRKQKYFPTPPGYRN